MEAIKIAEEREALVKSQFDKYDVDASGTIEMEELLSLLEDLGMTPRLKTDATEFCSNMFIKYDANDDGVLDFEEFKSLYNAAIDDSHGKKTVLAAKPTPIVGRDSKGLDGGTLAARKALAEEKARKKAEEAERIRKQNAEMKAKILAKNKGADAKALDAECEAKRRAIALAAVGSIW